MADLVPLLPRQAVPALSVPTTGGARWTLNEVPPRVFTMVVFYRGLHCPICGRYLAEIEGRLDEFVERGVEVMAISADPLDRAQESLTKWRLTRLALGHSLPLETARAWGLYLSRGRGKTSGGVMEPVLFHEPGLFLVRPDGTLYFAQVQTAPFTRPNIGELLSAIDFVQKNDYPARGEVADLSATGREGGPVAA